MERFRAWSIIGDPLIHQSQGEDEGVLEVHAWTEHASTRTLGTRLIRCRPTHARNKNPSIFFSGPLSSLVFTLRCSSWIVSTVNSASCKRYEKYCSPLPSSSFYSSFFFLFFFFLFSWIGNARIGIFGKLKEIYKINICTEIYKKDSLQYLANERYLDRFRLSGKNIKFA